MRDLRFAMIGAGFWARCQLAAWGEVAGARCVALCDRTRSKAELLAREFGVGTVYADAADLLATERLDFVEIVTDADSHEGLAMAAARHGVGVVCQKPLAPTLAAAARMVDVAKSHGTPLLVHENWRWQAPIRAFKKVLASNELGRVVRGRLDYANSFPVFANQPSLKEQERFILLDMGTHILDVARFLWGEADQLYCQTRRIHPGIRGEDVATVMMRMGEGATVTANLSYASKGEQDRFPETMLHVEGTEGGASLGPDHTLRVTTAGGTRVEVAKPPHYAWSDPAYALVHAGMVECHRHLLGALRGEGTAETTGEDNLKTLRLVFAAYESAEQGKGVRL